MTSYNVPVVGADGAVGQLAFLSTVAADLGLIQAALPVVGGGLSGAVTPARFVGGTVSGAPTTGTFAVSDFVVDQSGAMWACTAAGTPGSWVQVGAGGGGAMTNPMTAAGDLIKGGSGGTPARLAIGSSGQALIVSGGAPAWGSVGIAGGGTGQATQQAALNALAGTQSSGKYLRSDGTNTTLDTLHAADVPQLADYAPTGLTGAVVASRYVGATASGAPTSGTFATADFVVTQDGHVFVCTAGGTPGTWANAGASAGVSTFNSRSGSVSPGNADYLAVASGGLTGATTGTRYAGGTAGGAPASGTFSTGDFIVDVTGKIFICTAGGTPGTWKNAGSLYALLSGATLTGYLAPAVVTLTGATTVTVDASAGNDFRLTLTASTWTMGNPSNPVDGERIDFQLQQDGTGSRTIAWGTAYDFGTLGSPVLTTTASKGDIVGFVYYAASSKWRYLGGGGQGFA